MSAGYIIYSLNWDKFRQLVERPTRGQLVALGKLLSEGFEEADAEFEEDDAVLKWPTNVDSLAQIAAQRLALPDWYGDLSDDGKSLWEGVVFEACMDLEDIDVGFRVDSDGIYWDVIEVAWQHLGVVPGTITDTALSAFGTRPYRYFPRNSQSITRRQYDQQLADAAASRREFSDKLERLKDDLTQRRKDLNQVLDEFTEQGIPSLTDLLHDLSDGAVDQEESDFDDWSPMHSMHTPDEVDKMRAELQSVEPVMKATTREDARRDYEDELMPAVESISNDRRMLFVQVDT